MKIIAFAGSNSSRSINHKLVSFVSSLATKVEVDTISLRDFEAPVFGIDMEEQDGFPASMKSLKQLFDTADGFLVSVPEHNGSMPAVFKNTIDWLSRMGSKPFQNKPTLFLSATPGGRAGILVREHLESIMQRGTDFVGHYGVGNFGEKFVDDKFTNEEDIQALTSLMQELENRIFKAEEQDG